MPPQPIEGGVNASMNAVSNAALENRNLELENEMMQQQLNEMRQQNQ